MTHCDLIEYPSLRIEEGEYISVHSIEKYGNKIADILDRRIDHLMDPSTHLRSRSNSK
jgi:hypothetical protein